MYITDFQFISCIQISLSNVNLDVHSKQFHGQKLNSQQNLQNINLK